jgi:hypothetical protein
VSASHQRAPTAPGKGRLPTEPATPFDLSTQQRIEYETLDGMLLERLKGAIDALSTRRL